MSTFRSELINLIYATVHHLADANHENCFEDEHYRSVVTKTIDAILYLAHEIDFDLWAEWTAPVAREDAPLARLLRDAAEAHGMPRCCIVPECEATLAPLADRPRRLPRGTAWPTCPELCAQHAEQRCAIIAQRAVGVRRIHVGLMPLPDVVHPAPSPGELYLLGDQVRRALGTTN